MSKGEQTRARLVEKTANLIAAQGYHATGLNQITQESGAPIGSLYYHFRGGKDELVTTAMQASGDAIAQGMAQIFAATDDLATAIRAVVGMLGDQLAASGYRQGCPIATVTLETASQNDALQAASLAVYSRWQAMIAGFLIEVGAPAEQAEGYALFSLAAIEGGLLLSRAARSPLPLRQAGENLIRFLERELVKG